MALEITETGRFNVFADKGEEGAPLYVPVGEQECEITQYVRVESMEGGRDTGRARVSFSVLGSVVREVFYDLPFNITTELTQASNLAEPVYLFLKTLPEFAEAKDV